MPVRSFSSILLGALLNGCGPLNIDLRDEAYSRKIDTERKGHAARVELYEGLTFEDFENFLPDVEGKEEFLNSLPEILVMEQEGDPFKIDPGLETFRVARYFDQQAPHLSFFGINGKDIEQYEKKLNRAEWEAKREEIKKTFRIEKMEHPFVRAMDGFPVNHWTLFRSLPVFKDWAVELLQTLESVRQNRSVTILYPGSGSHIAPLMTAVTLIDQGAIDQAEFIYTEIKEDEEEELRFLLSQLTGDKVFEKFWVGPWTVFGEEGKERVLEVFYQGKTIRILFALNRSGEKYYRREYLERADAVILHDPGHGYLEESFKLLAKMLIQKQIHFPDKRQLLLMEGEQPKEGLSHFPEGMAMKILEGPYGHCEGGAAGVGEVADCEIAFARSFLLNDPVLSKRVSELDFPESISGELFAPKSEVEVFLTFPTAP